MTRNVEDPRVQEAFKLLQSATGNLSTEDRERRKQAVRKLLTFQLEGGIPEALRKDNDHYNSERDNDAPFFTEAFLYALLGKHDARTVLAYLHGFLDEIGFSRDEQRTLAGDQGDLVGVEVVGGSADDLSMFDQGGMFLDSLYDTARSVTSRCGGKVQWVNVERMLEIQEAEAKAKS